MEKPLLSTQPDAGEPSYDLHQAAFEGRLADVQTLLKNGSNPNVRDRHGNTPLGLAIHNKHVEVVKCLLENGADPTLKSKASWSPIREALASSSIPIVAEVHKALQVDSQKNLIKRMTNLKKALEALPDFYMELDWEFKSWVPFLSRFCPSDKYRIWKKGSTLRGDSSLVGFENLNWLRGHVSVVFRGDLISESKPAGDLLIIDHVHKTMENAVDALDEDPTEHLNDEVAELMGQEILATQANVDNVKFSVSKSWLGNAKTSKVGKYESTLYQVEGFQYRVLHRTMVESMQPKEKDKVKVRVDHSTGDDLKQTWDRYINVDNKGKPLPLLYRHETIQVKEKSFKGTVFLSKQFPRKIEDFLPIFEVLAPTHRGFQKLSEFVRLKLPDDGFPVKLELPVFPTVTGLATFSVFEEKQDIDETLFAAPSDYKRSKIKFMGGEKKKKEKKEKN